MSRRRGFRQVVEADLDIMPLMNLFVVLIPMLLLSAVFVEMAAVNMDLPSADAEASTSDRTGLDLSVRLEASRYVVDGRSLRATVIERVDESSDEELAALLLAIREKHPDEVAVRIESPEDARYQEIIAVMDISREAGLSSVSLTEAATGTREAR